MTTPTGPRAISPQEFSAEGGLEQWRVLARTATARFATGSFDVGLRFVDVVGAIAGEYDHHPDVDLRYGSVTIGLTTHDVGGLSDLDVAVARRISAAAKDLGVSADPSGVHRFGITIDTLRAADVLPFWAAVLGYQQVGDADLVDPDGRGPRVWFQQEEHEPRRQRNRIHIDVSVPHDEIEQRVRDAVAAGGRVVTDAFAPSWWTLADAEGNEADLASWLGRD